MGAARKGFIHRHFQYLSNKRRGVRCLQPVGTRVHLIHTGALGRDPRQPASGHRRQWRVPGQGAGCFFAAEPQKARKIIKKKNNKKIEGGKSKQAAFTNLFYPNLFPFHLTWLRNVPVDFIRKSVSQF